MKIFKKLFGSCDCKNQEEFIEKEFKRIEDKAFQDNINLKQENASILFQLSKLKSENDSLRNTVREQNEADLFLEIKKIEKQILEGKKKDEINIDLYNQLKEQRNALTNTQGQMISLLGQVGGAGLGIFR